LAVIPTREELIEYVHKKVAEKKYGLEILDIRAVFAIDVERKIMQCNPNIILKILGRIIDHLEKQGFTWKDYIDSALEHEFKHEVHHYAVKCAGYKGEDFEYGVVTVFDYLAEVTLPEKLRKVAGKVTRIAFLPDVKERYEALKKPIEFSFPFCGVIASFILLKEITLDEVAPYLSKKSLQFVKKWIAILKKVRDVSSGIRALKDVENLYFEWIATS